MTDCMMTENTKKNIIEEWRSSSLIGENNEKKLVADIKSMQAKRLSIDDKWHKKNSLQFCRTVKIVVSIQ